MTALFSYLITFLGILFWLFRVVVCLMSTIQAEFFATPLDLNLEIGLLFVTIICFVFIFKRNLIAATIYFGAYFAYFGTGLYNQFMQIQETGISVVNSSNTLVLIAGIIIPMLTFFDILLNKSRKGAGGDRKTDWFFTNKDFDRQYDERADKNQYRL